MATQGYGQMSLDDAVVARRLGSNARLDKIERLVDWSRVEQLLAPIYSSPVGQDSYPVLTLFKAQLLGRWYQLSDPALEEALADRLSFRRFVGLGLDAPVPDHCTLWRFREQMAQRGLDRAAFEEIGRQLAERGLILKHGTLMDATVVQAQARPPAYDRGAAAGSRCDPDAAWTRKRGQSFFGYGLHVGVDQGSGLIRTVQLTEASCNESEVADDLVCGDEAAVYGDKGYENKSRRARLKAQGIKDRIMHRADKHRPQLPPWQQRRNQLIARIRAAVERVLGTLKRGYGLHRARGFSLAANRADAYLTAIAYNLRRARRLEAAA